VSEYPITKPRDTKLHIPDLTPFPIATPFVSSSQSLIFVIHKMLKASGSSLAILNRTVIEKKTRVYNGHELIARLREFDMYSKYISYSGRVSNRLSRAL
jgi:hypothetical protein